MVLAQSSSSLNCVTNLLWSPERAAVLQEADRFNLQGDLQRAERISSQVKPSFPAPAPIATPDDLPSGGAVYYQQAQQAKEQGLSTKLFINLHLLTSSYPDFLPGHLMLADGCREDPEGCQRNAKTGQPQTEAEVLERSTNIFPENVEVLDRRLALLGERRKAGDLLEASIAARQFAISYPEHPKSSSYLALADQYIQRYLTDLQIELQLFGAAPGGQSAPAAPRINLPGIRIPGLPISVPLDPLIDEIQGKAPPINDPESLEVAESLVSGEAQYGQQLANQYKQSLSLLTDAVVQGYVNEIGQKLSGLLGRDDFAYEFFIVNDGTLNAFALPGGKIFINTGAIIHARSEAELAGVIAHELAHSALSHKYQEIVEEMRVRVFRSLPLVNLFAAVGAAEYNRNQEFQADLIGTRALAEAGYAADGMHNLLEAILTDPDGRSSCLDHHPRTQERVDTLKTLISRGGYNRYGYEGVARHAEIRARLLGEPSPIAPTVTQESTTQVGLATESLRTAPTLPPTAPSPPATVSAPPATLEAVLPPPAPLPTPTRPLNQIPLGLNQTLEGVTIRLESANISTSGNYVITLVVENQSDELFGFVPFFADVRREDGASLTRNLDFGADGDALVEPQTSATGKLSIFGAPWRASGSQGLTFELKEGTTGGRIFRIAF